MAGFFDAVSYDVSNLKNSNSRNRNIFIVQLLILLAVSVIIGMLLSPKLKKSAQNEPVAPQEIPNGAVLEIKPQDHIMKIDEELELQITLNGDQPAAMDIALSFDPSLIEIKKVVNGDLFDREIINKTEDGKIMFSAAKSPGAHDEKDSSVVAILTIKALKKTEETKISFIQNQTIAAKNGENILTRAQEAVIHIFD